MAKGQQVGIPEIDLFNGIDSGAAALVGKRVFYMLTDDEGGNDKGDGRKVPAIITRNYRGKRSASGQLVSDLFVMRPASKGGCFDKAEVPSNVDRSPGTWCEVQPGDLRN